MTPRDISIYMLLFCVKVWAALKILISQLIRGLLAVMLLYMPDHIVYYYPFKIEVQSASSGTYQFPNKFGLFANLYCDSTGELANISLFSTYMGIYEYSVVYRVSHPKCPKMAVSMHISVKRGTYVYMIDNEVYNDDIMFDCLQLFTV